MAAPTTADELLELVRKSGVIEDKRLDAYLLKIRTGPPLPQEIGKAAGILVRDGILTHFQAEQFLLGKWRRFTIGKYKVLERLGSGGMGSVYLCEHKFMRRRVAVKVLPTSKAEDSSALERFYREARAVAALDHPNIVRAYDIDQDDKLHFLVMEYIDGSSLQELGKRHGPMDVIRAAHYIRQAALGLQHAHQTAGLVHRDIKPGNILVDRAGTVKVLDMGLARFFYDEESIITKKYDENVLGTADYLAPEQAIDSHSADIRADIYSLGATFYFCLAGNTPFNEGTVAQKLIWHQTRQPKPIRSIRPEVPEGIAAIIEKMMAKEPAERFQTPAELVLALAPWTGTPIAPPKDNEMPRLSPAASGNMGDVHGPPSSATPLPVNRTASPGPASPYPGSAAPGYGPGNTPRPGNRSSPLSPYPGTRGQPSAVPAQPYAIVSSSTEHDPNAVDSWANLAPDTDDATGRVDTAPHSIRRHLPAAIKSRQVRRRWAYIGTWTGIGLVTCGIIFWAVAGKPDRTAEPTSHSERPSAVLNVSRSTENTQASRTVRQALEKARPGDHIVVLDDKVEESLNLDGLKRVKDVTIEAGVAGHEVHWLYPASLKEDGPFIAIGDVEGLHIKGFKFDGLNRTKDLIVLNRYCTGVTIEDCHFQGFKHAAIALWNCTGKSEQQPVSLQRLRIIGSAQAEAGVVFNVNPRVPPPVDQHVKIADCRFEGPCKAAVELAGPVLDLDFRHNRVYKCDTGILYKKAIPYFPIRATIASNTFCDLQQDALQLEALPAVETHAKENRIILENNLFFRTATLIEADEALNAPRWSANAAPPAMAQAHWIWFNEGNPLQTAAPGDYFFRKTFSVNGALSQAVLEIACDDGYTLWLNGNLVPNAARQDSRRVRLIDVTRFMGSGLNVLAMQAAHSQGPAGLLAQLQITLAGKPRQIVISDPTWKASREAQKNWQQATFDDSRWAPVKDMLIYGQAKDEKWDKWTWDSAGLQRFEAVASQLFPSPSGNVRDLSSREGNIAVNAAPLDFTLPTDPADDATFLHYPPNSKLNQAGVDKAPVGAVAGTKP